MKNIALHILDLVQNSARAKAGKVLVSIMEDPEKDHYILSIDDDGDGMDENQLRLATDPFYTSRITRKVGLGLPLIQQNTERTGGTFRLLSEAGKGTSLMATFVMSHPDRLPLGEIDEVLVLLAVGLPQLRLIYEHKTPFGQYRFDTEVIREIVGNIHESNQEIRIFIREMIMENLYDIKAEA
jgi:anti-sigma regulatory factor (Ser/Thr protein kinase)